MSNASVNSIFLLLMALTLTLIPECNLRAEDKISNSGKKITWHNRGGEDSATGGLEIFAEPVSADVYINGKLAGSTPLTLEKVDIGSYEIRIKAKGYGDYRTYVEVVHDKFLVVNAKLSRAHHVAWQQSRTAAIQSSMLFPGKGQVDLGYKNRGWTYFFGFAAAGWYAYYSFHKNEDERNKYNTAQSAYLRADNTQSAIFEYNNMESARQDMRHHQSQYKYALIAMGSVWAMNMIDVMFISGREPIIEAFGKNVKIMPRLTTTNLTLKLLF